MALRRHISHEHAMLFTNTRLLVNTTGEGHDLSDLFSDFYAVATHSPKPCASPPVCGLDACTGNVLGRIAVG
eukprot:m.1350413 g.1350413  ORF g.1350413 m.1350413 type:complete len:72 (-) comp24922_c0_seq1:2482-2697(-)